MGVIAGTQAKHLRRRRQYDRRPALAFRFRFLARLDDDLPLWGLAKMAPAERPD